MQPSITELSEEYLNWRQSLAKRVGRSSLGIVRSYFQVEW